MQQILIGFLEFLLGSLVLLIPDFNFSSSAASSVKQALKYLEGLYSVLNFFIPLQTIFTIIGIAVGIYLIRFTLFLVNWIVKRIRGG